MQTDAAPRDPAEDETASMRLAPAAISAWALLNSSGAFRSRDDEHAEDLFQRSGLSDQKPTLGLDGFWGRITEPLPKLPSALAPRDSRATRLLHQTIQLLKRELNELGERYAPERIGVVLSSSTGGIDRTEQAFSFERTTGKLPAEYSFDAAHGFHALLTILYAELTLRGPGYVISTACSSSGKALAAAQRLLHLGTCDAVVVGGVDALCETTLRGFGGLQILSKRGCRPFDRDRDGISIGEGAALLILEHSSPRALGWLVGVGESNDAFHATAPHPQGRGAALAIKRALAIAGIGPDTVDYVNAHGTGTLQNDLAESIALQNVFGTNLAFSSTKHLTGHLLGASGATEAILSLEAITRGTPPFNHVLEAPDERLPIQPLTHPPAPRKVSTVVSNSFAFGGSNVSVLLQSEPPLLPRPTSAHKVYLCGATSWFETPNTRSPPAMLLDARTRGRASQLSRLVAELFEKLRAKAPHVDCPSSKIHLALGSAYGEVQTTLALLDQLADEALLSPAKFQASVHNTALGLLTIELENRAYASALAAGPETAALTLFDAWSFLRAHGGTAFALSADENGAPRLFPDRDFPALGIGFWLQTDGRVQNSVSAEILDLKCITDPDFEPRSAPIPSSFAHVPHLEAAPAAWGLHLVDEFERFRKGESGALRASTTHRIGPSYELVLGPIIED